MFISKYDFVVSISVLVGLHINYIFAAELPKTLLETLDETKTADMSKEFGNEVNLETKTTVNEDEIYQHQKQKDNKVNERSFIFIQGPKYKLPHLNALPQKKHQYKTFVSNIGPIEFIKYEELPPRYTHPQLMDPMAHLKSRYNNFYPPKSQYYSGGKNNLYKYQNEMNVLSNKVNLANGVIGLQYQDSRLKEDLINTHTKFQGLMFSDYNGKYHKDNQLKFKVIAPPRKAMPINREKVLVNQNIINNYNSRPKQQDYGSYKPQPTAIQVVSNLPSDKQNDVKPQFGYRTSNEPIAEDIKSNSNEELSPIIPKHDEHREYIELLKPPLLRAKLGANIDINNNIFDRFKLAQTVNEKNMIPFDQSYDTYYDKIANKPYRIKNDLRRKPNMETEVERSRGVPIRNNRSENTDDEPEFHDERILHKLEEINKINAALTGEDQEVEKKDNIEEKPMNTSIPIKEKKVVQSSPIETKSKCVYPDCEFNNSNKHKCMCPSNKNRIAPLSPNSYSLSAEITPVNIDTIRQFGH